MSRSRSSRSRAFRPSCSLLESRELLWGGQVFGLPALQQALLNGLAQNLILTPTVPLYAFGPVIPNMPAQPTVAASTMPSSGPGKGDVNPYGVAFVPRNAAFFTGVLRSGDVLVSNFNNNTNTQGTGTTIMRITPTGFVSTFYNSPVPGLSTALGVLNGGFVIVGNAPTPDGTLAHMGKGSLQVIDRFGHLVMTITDPNLIQGPWDLTINDHGALAQVFVSNALTGAITRIDLLVSTATDTVTVLKMTQIASYPWVPNAAAVVLAPTGLAYDQRTGTLYVASTADNAIFAVANAGLLGFDAGKGRLVYNDPNHLNGPLGLALAPNGDLLLTNGDAFTTTPPPSIPNSALIEITPAGRFVAQRSLDPMPGAAFGLAIQTVGGQVTLATVNDDLNNVNLWVLPPARPLFGPFLPPHLGRRFLF
jgi:hypothetical protein